LLFLGNISKEHKTGIHNRVKPQKFSTVLERLCVAAFRLAVLGNIL